MKSMHIGAVPRILSLMVVLVMIHTALAACAPDYRSSTGSPSWNTADPTTAATRDPFSTSGSASPKENNRRLESSVTISTLTPGVPLVYDGAPVGLSVEISISGAATSMGLYLFVNGFLQPYAEEGGPEAVLHAWDFPEGETVRKLVHFTPIVGEQGEELTLCPATILNPKAPASDNMDRFSRLVLHRISGHNLMSLTMLEAAPPAPDATVHGRSDATRVPMPDAFLDNYESVRKQNGDQIMQIVQVDIASADTVMPSATLEGTDGETLPVPIRLWGGPSATYRVSLYLDHEPLTRDGQIVYWDMTTDIKRFSCTTVSLTPEEYSGKTYLYLIAVPLDLDEPPATCQGSDGSVELILSNEAGT